ncbi:MAG: hypothetical protein H6839_16560 [Planctomycetes bacterium]|nr:hypothetical protein [Planctomycetota bacterium]
MNRKKKEWMKAAHARQKAARLARRGERASASDVGVDVPAVAAPEYVPGVGAPEDLPPVGVPEDVQLAAPAESFRPGDPVTDPVAADALIARAGLDEARELTTQARELDDDAARAMLVRAAYLLDDVIRTTSEALESVPAAWRQEIARVVKARPEGATGDHRKRPRNGPDPVITLMKLGTQAASLQKRIIAKTNPELGRARRVA